MLIGAMNDPRLDVFKEINWIAESGFDFIDLTVEPPAAYYSQLAASKVREVIEKSGLEVVGHTFFGLPVGSSVEGIRRAACQELSRSFEFLAEVGAKVVNVHLDGGTQLISEKKIIEQNLASLEELLKKASELGLKLMVEHYRGPFARPEPLTKLFSSLPELGFHLDVGHANLFTSNNRTAIFLDKFSDRLFHVHFSDNLGGTQDLHLPIGAGNIRWKEIIKALKKIGYEGTITLEVFSEYRDYLLKSKEIVEKLWQETR